MIGYNFPITWKTAMKRRNRYSILVSREEDYSVRRRSLHDNLEALAEKIAQTFQQVWDTVGELEERDDELSKEIEKLRADIDFLMARADAEDQDETI